ncbi:hypothetical protein DFH09DRAFT_1167080 [Mycena vulgaris]|nr:hypothetical protein DFH09DRAFT_1167080 [Mycena vulgaris]
MGFYKPSGARPASLKRQLRRLLSVKTRKPLLVAESSTVPTDIFLEIASHLTKPDIIILSSVSSGLRKLLLPEIYETVSLYCGNRASSSVLKILSKSPKLRHYIREVKIGPDWLSWPIDATTEFWVASIIEKISPEMKYLHSFTWCGISSPPDHLWSTLRKCCPALRNVHCIAQIRELDPKSELFQFENLTSFTLCVKESNQELVTPAPDLPPQLCDMLLQRCPDLEELTLQLSFSRNNLAQLSRITHGIWPRLRSFNIELSRYDVLANSHYPPSDELSAFLTSHPSITSLSIYPHTIPGLPIALGPTALPQLTSFTGFYHDVSALPYLDSLQSLTLVGSESVLPQSLIVATLQGLTSLTQLTIVITDAADTALLGDIFSACPWLEIFTLQFGSSCNMKQMKEISIKLQRLAHLRILTLSKDYRLADGTMLNAALALLAHNPGLQEIHLIWVSDKGWKQSGDYTMFADAQYIEAKEWGPRTLGGSFTRRFRYALEGDSTVLSSVSKGLAKMRW